MTKIEKKINKSLQEFLGKLSKKTKKKWRLCKVTETMELLGATIEREDGKGLKRMIWWNEWDEVWYWDGDLC
jgi:hypothetical protein